MEILGKIGIDGRLLIAQIINFGLLVWVLQKFLYAPMIRRIEKDEGELDEARAQKEGLEKEKKEFQEQKTREIAEARERAKEIIAEAGAVAARIEQKTNTDAEKELAALTRQSKEHLKTLEPILEERVTETVRKTMVKSLRQYYRSLPKNLQRELQNSFWQKLVLQTKRLDLGRIQTAEIVELFEKLKKKYSTEKTGEELRREMAEAISEKIGPAVLEYAYPIEKERAAELESAMTEQIGVQIALQSRENDDLISGFRLEVAGIIVESNLSHRISHEKTATS